MKKYIKFVNGNLFESDGIDQFDIEGDIYVRMEPSEILHFKIKDWVYSQTDPINFNVDGFKTIYIKTNDAGLAENQQIVLELMVHLYEQLNLSYTPTKISATEVLLSEIKHDKRNTKARKRPASWTLP